jgi:hypothetical protein
LRPKDNICNSIEVCQPLEIVGSRIIFRNSLILTPASPLSHLGSHTIFLYNDVQNTGYKETFRKIQCKGEREPRKLETATQLQLPQISARPTWTSGTVLCLTRRETWNALRRRLRNSTPRNCTSQSSQELRYSVVIYFPVCDFSFAWFRLYERSTNPQILILYIEQSSSQTFMKTAIHRDRADLAWRGISNCTKESDVFWTNHNKTQQRVT